MFFKKERRLPQSVIHFLLAVLALLVLLSLWGYSILLALLRSAPVLDRARLHLEQTVQIFDRDDSMLYQFAADQNRIFLPAENIPDVMKKAVVAIEDERFFDRSPCVDVRAVIRALKNAYFEGRIEGASTITQQLVRTLYLSPEKTLKRKFNEVVLACRLETVLTKDEILALYLNGVGFANGLYGIEQASKAYFRKSAQHLTVAEAAVLAAIPQRPTYYSPYGVHMRTSVDHEVLKDIRDGKKSREDIPESASALGLLPRVVRAGKDSVRLEGRSDAVVNSMLRLGFISNEEYAKALQDLTKISFERRSFPIEAPHFSLWMREQVESLLSTLTDPERWKAAGIKVRTTLNKELQWIAEDTIARNASLLQSNGAKNIALVALDRRTREIIAYVGNNDYFGNTIDGQIDMASVARQPGSSFKPIVYAAAFERGYTPDTFILDEPIRIGGDSPKNFDGGFLGWITARKAIGVSRNIPAIKAFFDGGGEDRVLALAESVGITTPSEVKREKQKMDPWFAYSWPMAIGALEVPLREMVQMYAAIAEHGTYLPMKYFCEITDREGHEIVSTQSPQAVQAIQKQAADGIDDILRDPSSKPEGYWRTALTIPGMEVGAKTGTSNICSRRDGFGKCTEYGVNNVWTLGYTDSIVVGVWVGNADGTGLAPLADGLTVAAPIWKEFLQRASAVYVPGNCSK